MKNTIQQWHYNNIKPILLYNKITKRCARNMSAHTYTCHKSAKSCAEQQIAISGNRDKDMGELALQVSYEPIHNCKTPHTNSLTTVTETDGNVGDVCVCGLVANRTESELWIYHCACWQIHRERFRLGLFALCTGSTDTLKYLCKWTL